MRKTQSDPTKIWNKTKTVHYPHLFNIVLEVLPRVIRQQKEIKEIEIGREEIKFSLIAHDIIVYLSDPKNSTRKLL